MTELYRHYDNQDHLLYVGISLSTAARTQQHMGSSGWSDQIARIEIERFPWRWLALEAEKTAIMVERPLFNVTHARPTKSKADRAQSQSMRRIFRTPDGKFDRTAYQREYMRFVRHHGRPLDSQIALYLPSQ